MRVHSRKYNKHTYRETYMKYKAITVTIKDGTKLIPSTQSIEYRVNFKVLVSPKHPIPSTFRYYFDTVPILYMCIIMMSCNEIQTEHNTLDLVSLC